MTKQRFNAPKHLTSNTKAWFKHVVDTYTLEPHHIRLLTLAAEAWDRGQASRAVIEASGMTFVNRFGEIKARPEVAIERDCRIAFARLIRELNLDENVPDESRPPALRY